jgi:hypothetical protein
LLSTRRLKISSSPPQRQPSPAAELAPQRIPPRPQQGRCQ